MATKTLDMKPGLLNYIHQYGVRESAILQELREATQEKVGPYSVMQISPEQGQLMAFLIRLMGAKRILEIGTFTGYSTLACAMALPETGCIVTCDISQEWTDMGRTFWEKAGVAHQIDLRICPADETLNNLLAEKDLPSFDMAFIDADKTGYDTYYEQALRLVRPGGVILIDNVLWGGAVADPALKDEDTLAIRKLNEKIHSDQRVEMSLVPIGDGLTLAQRKI